MANYSYEYEKQNNFTNSKGGDKMNKEEQGMLVHKMQLEFNRKGYKDDDGYSLKTDGILGKKTREAVKDELKGINQ